MGYASGTSITCYVHGDKSPYKNAHHAPNIYLKFKATTSRNGMNVTVAMTNMTFKALGGYGYKLTVYAKVGSGSWTELSHSTATTATTWTKTPSNKTFTLSNFTGTEVPIAIAAYSYDKKHCYGSSKKTIATYKFNVPAASYTLTYDANGGTNAPAAVTVTPGTTIPVTSEAPYYNVEIKYYKSPAALAVLDYVDTVPRAFTGWNTKADGTGTPYSAGQEITMTGNTTLYAQWDPANYTIKPYGNPLGVVLTFNPMGGTVSPTTHQVNFPQAGYSRSPLQLTGEYMPGQTYTLSVPVLHLYPQYSSEIATVQASDLPPALADSVITRAGYGFLGWYEDSELTTRFIVPQDLQHDKTLYAKWKALPLYIKTEDGWTPQEDNTVWQCVEETVGGETVKVWKKIAHIYKCVEQDGQKIWKDMSGES